MTIYLTSDLHFGHANIINICKRPFTSIDQMNHTLISNINNTVAPNDTLWILGDFSYKISRNDAIQFRKKINCKDIHLIYGNHDRDYNDLGIFSSTQHYAEVRTRNYGKISLFHYPIASWNGRFHGWLHCHGHSHNTAEYNINNVELALDNDNPDEAKLHRIWDVGVDANNYAPISLQEIAENFNMKNLELIA